MLTVLQLVHTCCMLSMHSFNDEFHRQLKKVEINVSQVTSSGVSDEAIRKMTIASSRTHLN